MKTWLCRNRHLSSTIVFSHCMLCQESEEWNGHKYTCFSLFKKKGKRGVFLNLVQSGTWLHRGYIGFKWFGLPGGYKLVVSFSKSFNLHLLRCILSELSATLDNNFGVSYIRECKRSFSQIRISRNPAVFFFFPGQTLRNDVIAPRCNDTMAWRVHLKETNVLQLC